MITHLLHWPKTKTLNTPNAEMPVRIWSNRNAHSCLVGMQYGRATKEDGLVVSHKTKHSLIIQLITFLDIYPKELKTYTHKNLHTDVYKQLYLQLPKPGGGGARWWCSHMVCSYPLGGAGSEVAWVTPTKVSSHLCFAQGHQPEL